MNALTPLEPCSSPNRSCGTWAGCGVVHNQERARFEIAAVVESSDSQGARGTGNLNFDSDGIVLLGSVWKHDLTDDRVLCRVHHKVGYRSSRFAAWQSPRNGNLDGRKNAAVTRKARRRERWLCFAREQRSFLTDHIHRARSIEPGRRATETIVQTPREEMEVLLDVINRIGGAGKLLVSRSQTNVIIFNAERPIRGEAELKTTAKNPTPACVAGRSRKARQCGRIEVGLIVRDCAAAFDIVEHIVCGKSHLTRKEAQGIDPRPIDVVECQTETRALQVRPVSLRLKTKNKQARLPIIPEVPTNESSTCIVATFVQRTRWTEVGSNVSPARMAPTIAGVGANIVAGPVERRLNQGGRCDDRRWCRPEVSCLCAACGNYAERNGTQKYESTHRHDTPSNA